MSVYFAFLLKYIFSVQNISLFLEKPGCLVTGIKEYNGKIMVKRLRNEKRGSVWAKWMRVIVRKVEHCTLFALPLSLCLYVSLREYVRRSLTLSLLPAADTSSCSSPVFRFPPPFCCNSDPLLSHRHCVFFLQV